MFSFHLHHKSDVLDSMAALRKALADQDPKAMDELRKQAEANGMLQGQSPAASIEQLRQNALASLDQSIAAAGAEDHTAPGQYQSHDKLTSLVQSSMNGTLLIRSHLGDRLPAVLNLFGQGNAVVWAPTGISALLEHFKGKPPFKSATDRSRIAIPDRCTIAILGDWGADNEHAQRLALLVRQRNPDYCIHLGDIYYSGTEHECQKFLENWPLKDPTGAPIKGRSFALNGNHEMYSEGRYYFTTVLDGFGQEASYFSLSNSRWQIFGLDTAYVPFLISGGAVDTSLKPQWDFLVSGINANPAKKNILLTHNQPLSAFVKETAAGAPLRAEYDKLIAATRPNAVYGWIFGHEHRCTVYDDSAAPYKARLLGNGAIPHDPQAETAPQVLNGISGTNFVAANHGRFNNGPLAISTFALLTVDGDRILIDYINEDGRLLQAGGVVRLISGSRCAAQAWEEECWGQAHPWPRPQSRRWSDGRCSRSSRPASSGRPPARCDRSARHRDRTRFGQSAPPGPPDLTGPSGRPCPFGLLCPSAVWVLWPWHPPFSVGCVARKRRSPCGGNPLAANGLALSQETPLQPA